MAKLTQNEIIEIIFGNAMQVLYPGDYVYDGENDKFVGCCKHCRELVRDKNDWYKESDYYKDCAKEKRQ